MPKFFQCNFKVTNLLIAIFCGNLKGKEITGNASVEIFSNVFGVSTILFYLLRPIHTLKKIFNLTLCL